jgi:hypothetical protein
MAELCSVRVEWDRQAPACPLPPTFHRIRVLPEPGWPLGRKGLALAGAWQQMAGPNTDGMLILDGDVAIDPLDLAAMRAAIHDEPRSVLTAPARLWPASTNLPEWSWAHWGTPGQSQVLDPGPVTRFSFCFTWLPRRLIHACMAAGLDIWTFPRVDQLVSQEAVRQRIPVRLVAGCWPKHLHY